MNTELFYPPGPVEFIGIDQEEVNELCKSLSIGGEPIWVRLSDRGMFGTNVAMVVSKMDDNKVYIIAIELNGNRIVVEHPYLHWCAKKLMSTILANGLLASTRKPFTT